MQELIDVIGSSDPITIIIAIIILIATGGVGTAIIQARVASKRGIKGDALVKEQNGIEGLTNLGELQGGFITTLQAQITSLQAQIDALKTEYRAELAYSNLLIQTLSENTVPIPPRPKG